MDDTEDHLPRFLRKRPPAERDAYLAGAALGARLVGRSDPAEPGRSPARRALVGAWGGLDLDAPSAIFVHSVVEIATALSRLARFNGWGTRFYSVAEHSVLCDELARDAGLPVPMRRAVLFHDAAEVYVGDNVRPMKARVPELAAVEADVFDAIAERFDIPRGFDVSAYDDLALAVEKRELFPNSPSLGDLPDPGFWQAPRLEPDAAALEFVRRAEILGIR